VAIGAHPGLPDLMGLRRRRMELAAGDQGTSTATRWARSGRCQGGGHHAPARQGARYPVPHVRGEP
jgi:hypothetical protein